MAFAISPTLGGPGGSRVERSSVFHESSASAKIRKWTITRSGWRFLAMKLLRCLPAFFLTVSVCVFGSMCADVWGAGAPSSARALGQLKSSSAATEATSEQALIPGPLRSFLRMAAISQQVSPDEVLPLLARNIVVSGYQGNKPTQFLILINWYIDQARELEALAGPQGVIRVSSCEDAKPLLVILGYRLRQPCGPEAAVETSNADRAFLTIDSGFPLAQLEETLRGGKP